MCGCNVPTSTRHIHVEIIYFERKVFLFPKHDFPNYSHIVKVFLTPLMLIDATYSVKMCYTLK